MELPEPIIQVSIPPTGIMPLRPVLSPRDNPHAALVSIPLTGIMPLRRRSTRSPNRSIRSFNPPDGDYASPTPRQGWWGPANLSVSIPLTGIMPLRLKGIELTFSDFESFNPPDGDYASPTIKHPAFEELHFMFQSP